MTDWPKEDKIQGRKPDKYYGPSFKEFPEWEEAIKPEAGLPDRNVGQSQTDNLDKGEFKIGALGPAVFYAGLEDEIARVAKKVGIY